MREKILELLPEIGVLGVPCVPLDTTQRAPYSFDPIAAQAALKTQTVLSAPEDTAEPEEHPEHAHTPSSAETLPHQPPSAGNVPIVRPNIQPAPIDD